MYNQNRLKSYIMTASEFVPGIVFKKTAHDRAITWKYEKCKSGSGVLHMAYYGSSMITAAQIEIKENGIIFWTYAGDVYVQSKLIPYSDLHLISKPVTA